MKKIDGVFLDTDYETRKQSTIRVFVKTRQGIQAFSDPKFRPYFFVKAKDIGKAKKLLEETVFEENTTIRKVEEVKRDGEKVLRLEFDRVDELTRVREEIKSMPLEMERFEYDIPFATRYIIDKQLQPMNGIEIRHEKGEVKKATVVEEKNPKQVQKEIDEGKFDSQLK